MSAILVAVTLLTKGHPTPRRRRPAEEPELGRFRCPAGSYLDSSVQMERSARLQAHVRAALARGLAPTALDAAPRALQNLSQQYTRESLAWPKPAYCRRRQADVCSVSPHFCLALPSGNSPRASLISEKYRLEFRQVWKVASSSLASFFFCNMWGDLKLRKVMPGTPPPAQGDGYIVAFPSRDPIGRFVASALEVLARLLSRVSPGGDSLPDAMFAEPSGPLSAGLLSRTTSWFAPLRRLNSSHGQGAAPWVGGGGPAGGVEGRGGAAGRAAAAAAALQERGSPAPTREALIDALVAGFVSDLECSIIYSASEHMSSQLSFVTSGMAKLAQLDAQIRLEHVAEDLEQLRSRIGYRRPNVPAEEAARDTGARDMSGGVGGGRRGGRGLGRASGGGSGEGDEWKCSLGRENQANGKGGLPVDSADIAAALRRSPALIQRLCTVYMQDFICLGYTLPRECADGRALEWLTPAPFDRPRNAGRRNLRLRG